MTTTCDDNQKYLDDLIAFCKLKISALEAKHAQELTGAKSDYMGLTQYHTKEIADIRTAHSEALTEVEMRSMDQTGFYAIQIRELEEGHAEALAKLDDDFSRQLKEIQASNSKADAAQVQAFAEAKSQKEDYKAKLADIETAHAQLLTRIESQEESYRAELAKLKVVNEHSLALISDQEDGYEAKLAESKAAHAKSLAETKAQKEEVYIAKVVEMEAAHALALSRANSFAAEEAARHMAELSKLEEAHKNTLLDVAIKQAEKYAGKNREIEEFYARSQIEVTSTKKRHSAQTLTWLLRRWRCNRLSAGFRSWTSLMSSQKLRDTIHTNTKIVLGRSVKRRFARKVILTFDFPACPCCVNVRIPFLRAPLFYSSSMLGPLGCESLASSKHLSHQCLQHTRSSSR